MRHGWNKISATLKCGILALQYLGKIVLTEVMVVEFLSQSKHFSLKVVKEFKPESEAEMQQLEIIFAEFTTLTGQRM